MGGEHYVIILDANVLGSYNRGRTDPKNFNYFSIKKEVFISLIKFLKDNSLTENIKVAIPKIVFEELKYQQIRFYNGQLSKLEEIFSKFREIPGFELKIPEFDYEDHLTKKIDAFTSKYDIITITVPEKDILSKLIDKVFHRDKPFYKKDNNIDSGFKDSLIWESILNYAEKNKKPNYFFFTKDDDFKDPNLLDEFSNSTGNELKIIETLSELKALIDDRIRLNLDFNLIRDSYNQDFKNRLYDILKSNFHMVGVEDDYFRVIDFRIGDKLFDINNLKRAEYELSIELKVIHETPYTGYSVVDEMYAHYETDESYGLIILKIEKNKENILYLTGIDFENIKLLGKEQIGKIRLN